MASLSSEPAELLTRYSSILLALGTRLGLIHLTHKQVEEQIDRSVALGKVLAPGIRGSGRQNPVLIDVGSGAGFPAIPAAIVLIDQLGALAPKFVLVEPRRKAVAFLEKVLRDLDLSAHVVGETAEVAAKNLELRGDFVTAKALAEPRKALELCAPVCKIGGHIVLAGRSDSAGLAEALPADALSALGLSSLQTQVVRGPNGASQAIHIVRRQAQETP